MISLSTALSAVIYAERRARGLSQQQLAKAAGMHPMALSKIERGIQKEIGVETLRSLAEAMSIIGTAVSTSELIATAEKWVDRLRSMGDQADKSGAGISAVVLLEMTASR